MDENKQEAEVKIPEEAPVYSRKRKTAVKSSEQEIVNGKDSADKDEIFVPRAEETPLVLINEVSRLFLNKMREHNEGSISGSYRHIIFHLAQKDGRTQLELARLTHLKPPTVSLSLAKLETGGYVRREADPVDLRQTRVYLTDLGRQIDDASREAFISFEKQAISGLTDEERNTLVKLLKAVREKI